MSTMIRQFDKISFYIITIKPHFNDQIFIFFTARAESTLWPLKKQRNKIKSIKHTLNICAVSEDKLIWDVFNQSFGSTLFNCLLWRDLQYALFPIEANGYMVLVNFQLLWKV